MLEPNEDHRQLHGPWSSQRSVVRVVKMSQWMGNEKLKRELTKWRPRITIRTVVIVMSRGVVRGDDPVYRPWRTYFGWVQVKTTKGFTDREALDEPWSPWRTVVEVVKLHNRFVLLRVWLFLKNFIWINYVIFSFYLILSRIKNIVFRYS